MTGSRAHTPLVRASAQNERPAGREDQPITSVYLYPGELLATADALAVSTVLGSCVCVCFWDCTTQRGGLNHFLLPHRTRDESSAGRFGRSAMEILLERVLALGCERRNLTARVFGGASQFEPSHDRVPIGEQNVAVALGFLEEVGIPVVQREVGGTRGRKIVFRIASGDVSVKTL